MAVLLYVHVCALVEKHTRDMDTVWIFMSSLGGSWGVYWAASYRPVDGDLCLCTFASCTKGPLHVGDCVPSNGLSEAQLIATGGSKSNERQVRIKSHMEQ